MSREVRLVALWGRSYNGAVFGSTAKAKPETRQGTARGVSPSGPAPVIAIDGPAAAGKTTVGRALAARLGYRFLERTHRQAK